MSVKLVLGLRTTYATRVKLMKIRLQNTTVKQMSLKPVFESITYDSYSMLWWSNCFFSTIRRIMMELL